MPHHPTEVHKACPLCGNKNVMEKMEEETIQYHNPPKGGVVKLTMQVPVMTCTPCNYQWTDSRAEDIHDAVVKEHIRKVGKCGAPFTA